MSSVVAIHGHQLPEEEPAKAEQSTFEGMPVLQSVGKLSTKPQPLNKKYTYYQPVSGTWTGFVAFLGGKVQGDAANRPGVLKGTVFEVSEWTVDDE